MLKGARRNSTHSPSSLSRNVSHGVGKVRRFYAEAIAGVILGRQRRHGRMGTLKEIWCGGELGGG